MTSVRACIVNHDRIAAHPKVECIPIESLHRRNDGDDTPRRPEAECRVTHTFTGNTVGEENTSADLEAAVVLDRRYHIVSSQW